MSLLNRRQFSSKGPGPNWSTETQSWVTHGLEGCDDCQWKDVWNQADDASNWRSKGEGKNDGNYRYFQKQAATEISDQLSDIAG